MGKRSTSKHAATARAAGARLRRLLVAAVCGGLMFVLSGLLLSTTEATRLRLALGAVVVVYAGLALAKVRRAKGGRRRALPAVPVAEDEELAKPSLFGDEGLEIFGHVQDTDELVGDVEKVEQVQPVDDVGALDLVGDIETVDLVDLIEEIESIELDDDGHGAEVAYGAEVADHAEQAQDEDEPADQAAEAELPPIPARLLEQLMQQAMAEEQLSAALVPEAAEAVAAQRTDAGVMVSDVITHDLVPISSLHAARAEAEQQSLQRLRATVRGIGTRTGDDPVAVDVLARVVAAVDRLMVSDSSFARPALSETGPLLAAAAAAAPQEATLPSREATPLPAVPTMRPSDMPVTELSAPVLPDQAIPDEMPALATLTTDTQLIDAVVVEDPELVLPIPAPPKPPPAPRGRRLKRHSVA